MYSLVLEGSRVRKGGTLLKQKPLFSFLSSSPSDSRIVCTHIRHGNDESTRTAPSILWAMYKDSVSTRDGSEREYVMTSCQAHDSLRKKKRESRVKVLFIVSNGKRSPVEEPGQCSANCTIEFY